jgi:hypothetical protein
LKNQLIEDQVGSDMDVKNVMKKMISFPYCCISWVFITPLKEKFTDGHRGTLEENFKFESVKLLSSCNQLSDL